MLNTTSKRQVRILLETSLQHIKRGELTPAAALLLCQECNYTDLHLQKDDRKKKGRGHWVAYSPSKQAPISLECQDWQRLVENKGKQYINQKLKHLKRQDSVHPVYVFHFYEVVWRVLFLFCLFGTSIIFGHIYWLVWNH